MAKIVQVITRPESEYTLQVAESQVRDLDAIVETKEGPQIIKTVNKIFEDQIDFTFTMFPHTFLSVGI